MADSSWANLTDQALHWALTSGARILFVAAVTLALLAALRRAVARFRRVEATSGLPPAQLKRANTLIHIARDVLRLAIVCVGGMMILSEVGLDLKPLLAAVGLGGLAIGFGAQSVVKDLISGFFILLENSVRVGDVVELAGVSGLVEHVELRTIKLRDLSGNVHVIPNGEIGRVTNMTQGFSCYVFDTGVAYKTRVDEAMALLCEIAEEMRREPEFGPDILEPLEMLGVDAFSESAVIIKSRIKTAASQQWRIGREMNRRIKNTFDLRGIEMPFPHRTIYFGGPTDEVAAGSQPPHAP